jgi:hypothetical protein
VDASSPLEATMQGETLEQWRKLCQEAAGELDPERLIELVREIDRMLTEKDQRLKSAKLQNAA